MSAELERLRAMAGTNGGRAARQELEESLEFWCGLLGFEIAYLRLADKLIRFSPY